MRKKWRGYWQTIRNYAASPKTRYEYKHYAWWMLLYGLMLGLVWGGIYLYDGNY